MSENRFIYSHQEKDNKGVKMEEPTVVTTTKFMKPTDYIKSDINILLLGESGVGKSTFINAFANYLQYETLEEALKSDLFCLIPTVFTIPDEDFQDRIVDYGYDRNEDKELGNSSTQGTRAYVFPLKGKQGKIRLIDTPGIGDSRGISQDEMNFENILTYLSQFKEIHAICFLLKPNVTVINAYFKFCIKHLISRLEVSASKNIVFIFTNSRSTFYKPGSTSRLLKIILDEIMSTPPNIKIPLSKDNTFCMDNEVFKYLVAVKKGISFGDAEKIAYLDSWEKSVESIWKFLHYIVGNEDRSGLSPHQMQNTLSVNNARRAVLDLTKPLADISDVIQDNLSILNMHKKHVLDDGLTMADLEKSLYIPIINLKQTSLPDPVVVCTSNTCSEICIVSGLKKYHYKQKCCKPCKVDNIERNIIGSPSLLKCTIFDTNRQCTECNCDFSCHMQILYETSLHEDTIQDESIKNEIKTKEDMIKARYKAIVVLKGRISEFEQERDTIIKTIVRFAHFLKTNSISSYNDAFEDYIDYLIERENLLGAKKSQGVISRYKYIKKQHEEEKKIFESVNCDGASLDSITPKEVQDLIESLYKLKHNGKKIKELHAKQQKVRQSLHEKSMEYCHPKPIEKPSKLGKAKNTNNLSEKLKKLNLSSVNLEQLGENLNLEEIVAQYINKSRINDNLASSSGAKPKAVKKKNNQDLSKNEKKTNIDQIKNNITKADTDMSKKGGDIGEKDMEKHNKPNESTGKKQPNQNQYPQKNPNQKQPHRNQPHQNQPYKNQHYHNQAYPNPSQNYNIRPGQNIPFNNPNPNQPNQFLPPMAMNQYPMGPYHPYQMHTNQFPMGMGPNPIPQVYPGNSNFQYGPQHYSSQEKPPSHHGSTSNLSQTSNENKKPRNARPNSRGKPRGNYQNVNQREQGNNSYEKGPLANKKEANLNKFKRQFGKKNLNQKRNEDSDSDDSQASKDASFQRKNKRTEKKTPEEELNYEMMKRFLEEQKRVIKNAKKKSGGENKSSETVIMMISRNE